MNKLINLLILAGLALVSRVAFAHAGHTDSVNFFSGFLHPITGWDHLFAILLVSFWSAFTLRKVWLGPLLFMGGMGLGVLLGIMHYSLVWFELGIAISIMGLGILIYLRKQFDPNLALGLISMFGLFHGYAHSDVLGGSGHVSTIAVTFDLCGLLIATSILHTLGIAVSAKVHKIYVLAHKGVGISALLIGAAMAFFG